MKKMIDFIVPVQRLVIHQLFRICQDFGLLTIKGLYNQIFFCREKGVKEGS